MARLEDAQDHLKPDDGKCLHYYVYLIDNHLELYDVRVPTWCPFRLQVYCNGHSYLARQLSQRKIEYQILDNAFGWIANFDQAQKLADEFRVEMLHHHLDDFAARYCPVAEAVRAELPLERGPSWNWPPMSCLPSKQTCKSSMTG